MPRTKLRNTFPMSSSDDGKEMGEFPFSWQLQRTDSVYQNKNRYVSNLKINTEWNLICIWSLNNPFIPEILEIRRRNSTAKEILVSGTFKLMHYGEDVLNRKFLQLIEASFSTARMELEYSSSSYRGGPYYHDPYYNEGTKWSMTGTLKISAYTADKEHVNKEQVRGVQLKSLLDLSNNLEGLLDPNATYFSDVNVNCGTVSFPAHKNILSARSPVFAAMFATQMKEYRNSKVDITDLSPNVLKTMLTFMYSGKTGELTVQFAGELLFAADKYQLDDLKRVCCDFLKSGVSVENVLRTLVLGYLHDKDLKVFAMDFICNSCEEFDPLEKTVEWRNLREKRPSLAMDVLTALVKSRDQKLKGRK